jgi:tetratricopeptide (TPR) repeat protein
MKKKTILALYALIMIAGFGAAGASASAGDDPRLAFGQKLQKALNTGAIKDALALFDNIDASLANDPQTRLLYASLLLSDNQLSKAKAVTDSLIASDSKNVDALVLGAFVAKAMGETGRKQTLIKQALVLDPTNPDANVELGNEQMLRKNYPLARRYFVTAIQGDSKNADALLGMGQASYFIGDFKTAETALNSILADNPRNSMAWAYLGKVAVENSKYAAALEYIETAIKHDPSVYEYWIDYGNYLRGMGKFADAAKAWEKAAALDPKYFLAYAYLAGIYDEMENYEASLKNYRLITQTNPDYYYAYEAIGVLAWRKENWEEARTAFSKAREKNMKNISYPLLVSATYLKEGKKKESRDYLEKAMKPLDKNSLDYAMARLYFDGLADIQVASKVRKEENSTTRGKMLFYLALFYDLNNIAQSARQYYLEVHNFAAPMFFEYRLNEWALDKLGGASE